jgi:hypothetical protein
MPKWLSAAVRLDAMAVSLRVPASYLIGLARAPLA